MLPFMNSPSNASHLTERVPIEAGFFSCLCNCGNYEDAQLRFCCYPVHMESQVRKNICSTYEISRYGNGNSFEPLCQDDVIFVTLRTGLKPSEDTWEDDLQLRYVCYRGIVSFHIKNVTCTQALLTTPGCFWCSCWILRNSLKRRPTTERQHSERNSSKSMSTERFYWKVRLRINIILWQYDHSLTIMWVILIVELVAIIAIGTCQF